MLALSGGLGYNVAGVLMDLAAELKNRVLIFDGAMGTLLYDKGYFLNACYEQLALTAPAVIESIHRDYLRAGADVLTTDTFGANPLRLSAFGLEDRTDEINEAAVRAARRAIEAEGAQAFVAGDIGPCSFFRQRGSAKKTVLRDAFRRQAEALARAGADFFLLETFTRLSELMTAAQAASEFGLPVAASFTPPGNTGAADEVDGEGVAAFVSRLDNEKCVQAIGMNCGSGPAALFSAAEIALKHTRKPLIVMPNAGLPRMVDGRLMYLTNPEYFTEYAKRYASLGVRGIGGCCGTSPSYTRKLAAAVGHRSPAKRLSDRPEERAESEIRYDHNPFIRKLYSGEKVVIAELDPPFDGNDRKMMDAAAVLKRAGVEVITFSDSPMGKMRASSVLSAVKTAGRLQIDTMPHIACRDRNAIGIGSEILGAYMNGIRNFLFVTGDPVPSGDRGNITSVYDYHSVTLMNYVRKYLAMLLFLGLFCHKKMQ